MKTRFVLLSVATFVMVTINGCQTKELPMVEIKDKQYEDVLVKILNLEDKLVNMDGVEKLRTERELYLLNKIAAEYDFLEYQRNNDLIGQQKDISFFNTEAQQLSSKIKSNSLTPAEVSSSYFKCDVMFRKIRIDKLEADEISAYLNARNTLTNLKNEVIENRFINIENKLDEIRKSVIAQDSASIINQGWKKNERLDKGFLTANIEKCRLLNKMIEDLDTDSILDTKRLIIKEKIVQITMLIEQYRKACFSRYLLQRLKESKNDLKKVDKISIYFELESIDINQNELLYGVTESVNEFKQNVYKSLNEKEKEKAIEWMVKKYSKIDSQMVSINAF